MQRRHFLRGALGAAFCAAARSIRAYARQDSADMTILSRHKIATVETRRVPLHYPRLVGRNARIGVHGRGPNLQIRVLRTDTGATGFGDSAGKDTAIQSSLQRLVGRRVSEVFDPSHGILDRELGPFDFALHDLAGKILDKPVYAMMGDHGPLQHDCYSGMIYFDDIEPLDDPPGIDRVLENCRQDIGLGYRQLKVKIGRGNRWMDPGPGMQRDIEVTRAIRQAFPEIAILVDGNNGFTPDRFLQYLEGLGDIELFWIEEPFQEEREGLQKLQDYLTVRKRKTYVAEGEAGFDQDFLTELAEDGLVDVFLPDIHGLGFTPWRHLMPQLKKRGILASPHAWGSFTKTCYSAHLATALGNTLTLEGVTCRSEQLDFRDYRLADGKLTTSPEPGFGMRLANLG
jgi:L-alanine-DL-glutamate epimerase-like enolase superfamily enzyme